MSELSEKKPAHHVPEGAPKTETPESPGPVPVVAVEQDEVLEELVPVYRPVVVTPLTQQNSALDIAVMPVDSGAPKWTLPRIP